MNITFSSVAHHLVAEKWQHLGLNFLWLQEPCSSDVGWTILYCQQSKQLPWAQHLYCEPWESILLWNGFLESSNVTAGS